MRRTLEEPSADTDEASGFDRHPAHSRRPVDHSTWLSGPLTRKFWSLEGEINNKHMKYIWNLVFPNGVQRASFRVVLGTLWHDRLASAVHTAFRESNKHHPGSSTRAASDGVLSNDADNGRTLAIRTEYSLSTHGS
jgi:hypothetical protein